MSDRALKAIAVAIWLNGAIFFAVDFTLGGDAVNGKRFGGHYYVGSHLRYTEVSFPVYLYSYVHLVVTAIGAVGFILIARRLQQRSR